MKEREEIVLELKNISKSFYLNGETDSFFALKDINFELKKGEVLGIIGRNGAGKSTMLKILSDVLPPSKGEVYYKGNIVSILDIGSGFHPDLSGYENIFINASILGMTKAQARKRVDAIIEFSGIGEFVHQPIKTYSNGMYLRLAFSIAVHLDPEILLLDEVVAVGDSEFKDKCSTKLYELAAAGLTIILVSHNMANILELCNRCIWLEKGRIKMDGPPIDVVENYIGKVSANKEMLEESHADMLVKVLDVNIDEFTIVHQITISGVGSEQSWPLYTAAPINIKIGFTKLTNEYPLEIAIYLTNLDGVRIFLDSFALRKDYSFDTIVSEGVYEVECTIPANLLTRGVYNISIILAKSFNLLRHLENVASFKVLPSTTEDGPDNHFNKMNTMIAPHLDWKINKK